MRPCQVGALTGSIETDPEARSRARIIGAWRASLSEDDPLVGTLVADRYRVSRRLGAGGMGVVYLAAHEGLRKQVALKVLATKGRIDQEAVARFEREAIASANLRHPNIAESVDFGRLPDGSLYLVMEYV